MITILKAVVLVFVGTVFAACTAENTTESIYKTLKEGQAKVIIRINGEPFYADSSVFTGSVDVNDQFFKMNLFDQFESNVVVGFGSPNWYAKHPIERKMIPGSQMEANVMIGKMVDRINRYGTGYLMAEGVVLVRSLSDEKIIMHFQGKVGKYSTMNDPQTWRIAEGDIIYRKPKIVITDVKKTDVYY